MVIVIVQNQTSRQKVINHSFVKTWIGLRLQGYVTSASTFIWMPFEVDRIPRAGTFRHIRRTSCNTLQ